MPRREDETSPRPGAAGLPPEDGILSPHLDEGTAHAWLDGALVPDEAARAAAHVAGCATCAALVAEAQGLLAGASRILGALDEVPGDVVPRDASRTAARDAALGAALAAAAAERRSPEARRAWYAGVPLRAAAAVLLVAGLGTVVVRSSDRIAPRMTATSDIAASEAMASSSAPSAGSGDPTVTSALPDSAVTGTAGDARPLGGMQGLAATGAATRAATGAAAAHMPAAPPALPPAESREAVAARREAIANDALARPDAQPMPRAPMPSPALPEASMQATLGGARDGVIAGRVTTPEGTPLTAAQVQVVGHTQGAVTDDSGRFVVPGVVPGPATVQARRSGYEPHVASVVVAAADTTQATLVLRSSATALSQVVVTGAGAAPPSAPAAQRALAARAANADSVARSARLDGAVEEARRMRATRLASAAGCYALTPDASGAAVPRATLLTLGDAPAGRRAGRQAYVARVLPDGVTGDWTPLAGDSLRVVWSIARGSVVLRLRPPVASAAGGTADVRRGVALIVDTSGAAGAEQPVTVRRSVCQPDLRR
jgi:hypothetical protein